jgi:hypothetical protein
MLLDQLQKHYVDVTCVQEMRWIGTGTIEKKEGRRQKGRPKLRWEYGVTGDAKMLEERHWRSATRKGTNGRNF